MTDYNAKIEKLKKHLEHVDEQIAKYEAMARKAKGPVSPSFAAKLEELKTQHRLLEEHVRDLKMESATNWSSDDPRIGVLKVCDEIAGRINDLFDRIKQQPPEKNP